MEFFTVTITSIYSVRDEKDKKGTPAVKKIALRGKSEISIGQRLKGGSYVGITPYGIILYDEDHPREVGRPRQKPEEVNTIFHGGKTSPIVALFLSEDKAKACFGLEDLKPSESRWKMETREVLNSIGDSHSVFIVSYWSPNLSEFHFPEN